MTICSSGCSIDDLLQRLIRRRYSQWRYPLTRLNFIKLRGSVAQVFPPTIFFGGDLLHQRFSSIDEICCASVIGIFEEFLSSQDSGAHQLSEKGVLQVLLDVKFTTDILSGGDSNVVGELHRNAKAKVSVRRKQDQSSKTSAIREHSDQLLNRLSQRLDPIDWLMYQPYLWENERQSYLRHAVLFGFFVQLNRKYTDTVQKLPTNSKSNILRCSTVPISSTSPSDIESKIRRIEDDPEGSGTSHLHSIIQGVNLQANRALKPLFERQILSHGFFHADPDVSRIETAPDFCSCDRNHGGFDCSIEIVFLGDMGAGKTSLVLRFVKGQFSEYQVTLSYCIFLIYYMAISVGNGLTLFYVEGCRNQ
ncbi:hypothetical protein Ahy_B08g091377 isoform F [Arachis hypogaea]|uniref:Conserved oligomeric Golgi complex subunit 1 n=1 Tax=Arachis hypogaea TaxID=3818 RepID=A0A444Y208_ARAHY|nr:hypothetical protein Ahy_B08g091377 isoform F [Arachis hypogaea]